MLQWKWSRVTTSLGVTPWGHDVNGSHHYLLLWNAIGGLSTMTLFLHDVCLSFDRIYSGLLMLLKTLVLPQKKSRDHRVRTQNVLNFILNATAMLLSSEPCMFSSTVFCFLLYVIVKALLIKVVFLVWELVWDLKVTTYPDAQHLQKLPSNTEICFESSSTMSS